jgi:hypothetical protein
VIDEVYGAQSIKNRARFSSPASALALGATVNFFRHEKRLGYAGSGLGVDLVIVVLTISIAFVAHLIEIALWAILFVFCGEFQKLGISYYHSAVNYSTLGYGI